MGSIPSPADKFITRTRRSSVACLVSALLENQMKGGKTSLSFLPGEKKGLNNYSERKHITDIDHSGLANLV